MTETPLTQRQQEILVFIDKTVSERGYPPSVREICAATGLASPSTVHSHLKTLSDRGYLRRDPTKPRAIEVTSDTASGTTAERRPTRHVPLVGDVAAGVGVHASERGHNVLIMADGVGSTSDNAETISLLSSTMRIVSWTISCPSLCDQILCSIGRPMARARC